MTSLATDFNESLVDGDRQEVRDSRQTYCEGVASLRASCILQNISVLESSMIPYLQEFIYEIMDLQNLCEERLKYKLNYDHYVEKVDTMTKDPTCKEANLRRVRFLPPLNRRIKRSSRAPSSSLSSSKLPWSND